MYSKSYDGLIIARRIKSVGGLGAIRGPTGSKTILDRLHVMWARRVLVLVQLHVQETCPI